MFKFKEVSEVKVKDESVFPDLFNGFNEYPDQIGEERYDEVDVSEYPDQIGEDIRRNKPDLFAGFKVKENNETKEETNMMDKRFEEIRKSLQHGTVIFSEGVTTNSSLIEENGRQLILRTINAILDFCKEADMGFDEAIISALTATAVTDETEIETFDLEGDVFVVPNGFRSLNDFWNHQQPLFNEYLALNDIIVEEDEKEFVEVWITNSESSNIGDHGITLTSNKGNKMDFEPGDVVDFIPLHILKSVHEGDTFTFTMPSRRGVVIKAKLTAKQLDYRYRRFGKFEDVINKLSTR